MGIAELLASIVLGASPSSCLAASALAYRDGAPVPSLRSGAFTAELAFYRGPAAMDASINQADQATMHVGRANRIVWRVRGGRTRVLTVEASVLGASARIVQRLRRSRSGQFSSDLTFPEGGCWSIMVRSGKRVGYFLVRATAQWTPACEPSRVIRSSPHPKFGWVTWLPAHPRPSGIDAVRFVSTLPDAETAVIYAGGRAPEGSSTKFLWWSTQPAASVELVGTRLDFPGSFRQSFNAARAEDDGSIIYPSVVNIPSAGCWAVRVRIGSRAGLVVFQAVVTG
jgi:hypothetical protein